VCAFGQSYEDWKGISVVHGASGRQNDYIMEVPNLHLLCTYVAVPPALGDFSEMLAYNVQSEPTRLPFPTQTVWLLALVCLEGGGVCPTILRHVDDNQCPLSTLLLPTAPPSPSDRAQYVVHTPSVRQPSARAVS
jgi:hypothetical protein